MASSRFMPTGTLFQSTPSARRATKELGIRVQPDKFQSTPSARRATRLEITVRAIMLISIHALREESD